MTAPRQVLPNTTYLITRRCIGRRFFLKPLPVVTQAFGYLLAVVAARHGLLVHVACVLSNHFHLVVTDPNAAMPRFMQELNGTLARFLNALHGRKENVFPGGSYSAVELADEEAVLEACAYTLANPVEAGLVRRASRWPGLWSAPEEIGGRPRTMARPGVFFDPHGVMPASAKLEFRVPRGFEREAFRKALSAKVEGRERAAVEAMRKARRKFLGVKGVMAQSPEDRATGEEKPRGRKNRVSATDPEKLMAGLARRRAFLEAYQDALAAYQAGRRETRFPPGTYLLRVHLGVVCAAAG